MKNTSKRIMFIVLSLVFLLASVWVYSSLIRSSYQGASDLRVKYENQKDVLDKYQSTITKVKKLFDELNNSSEIKNQVSLVLPKEKDVAYLVAQINGLAKLNSLNVESISTSIAPLQPSKSKIVRSIGQMKADVKMSGSYGGFKAFIDQMQNNVLILDIADIKIDSPAKTEQQLLNYTLSIRSYYQSQ